MELKRIVTLAFLMLCVTLSWSQTTATLSKEGQKELKRMKKMVEKQRWHMPGGTAIPDSVLQKYLIQAEHMDSDATLVTGFGQGRQEGEAVRKAMLHAKTLHATRVNAQVQGTNVERADNDRETLVAGTVVTAEAQATRLRPILTLVRNTADGHVEAQVMLISQP